MELLIQINNKTIQFKFVITLTTRSYSVRNERGRERERWRDGWVEMHCSGNIDLKDKRGESIFKTQQKEKSTGGQDTF